MAVSDSQYNRGIISAVPVLRILDAEVLKLGKSPINVFNPAEQRRIHAWRESGVADFDVVDRIFSRLALSDHFIFDDELSAEYYRVNLDRQARSRSIRSDNGGKRTHCRHGHKLAGENVRVRSNGKRECATCARARNRKSYHAMRQRQALDAATG